MKIYELAKTVQLFEQASRDESLRIVVPPIVATSFGIYPLSLEDQTLTVACPAWVTEPLLSMLERGLDLAVQPLYFEKEIILGYITKVYLQEATVNVPTFQAGDFLSEENFPLIFREKEDCPYDCAMHLRDGQVLFLDFSFRSELRNLDRREGYPFFEAGSLEVPFTWDARGATVYTGPLEASTFCVIKRSNLYSGVENRHGFTEHRVDALPFNIHPTEVQICRIDRDGTVHLNVYDRTETVRPGATAEFTCRYFFLHFGNRYSRTIGVRVHDVVLANRGKVQYGEEQPPWSLDDLDRWLGLNWGNGREG